MGGGLDVKDAYSWMIDKMTQCKNAGGNPIRGNPGNFVVIRAGGNPSYDSFIYKLGPVASVQTVVIPNRESAGTNPNAPLDDAVEAMIKKAGAIFLTGGDQGDYYYF
jgi:cyanophycinase-like exopeptidase